MRLKQRLRHFLTEFELSYLNNSYDIIGDIAVTSIAEPLWQRRQLVGTAILSSNNRIKTVLARTGSYQGKARTTSFTCIVGQDRTTTMHMEHGLKLFVDLAETYFSPRMGVERQRIAKLIQPDEHILVMFSGIAPLPLAIANTGRCSSITAIEANPDAHACAVRNLALNKAADTINVIHGDVGEVIPNLPTTFDRVVMPHPHGAVTFIPEALSVLRRGGWLHWYCFHEKDGQEELMRSLARHCATESRAVKYGTTHLCGHCGRQTYRVCVDGCIL
ncbi:MAG TPA: hypothetical protein DDX81_10660 [Desulfofustis sp.]|nr:hypothetical protein [Desulfofustis sp.]